MPCNTEQVRKAKGSESIIKGIPHLIRSRYLMIREVCSAVLPHVAWVDAHSLQRIGLAITQHGAR
jgi:hypothetical protein